MKGGTNSEMPIWKVFMAAAKQARAQRQTAEAENLYKKALELTRQAPDAAAREAAHVLLQIADFYQETKNFELAESSYQDALERFQVANGTNKIPVVLTLTRLAELYEIRGDGSRAQEAWTRVRAMLSEQLKNLVNESESP